MASELVQIPPKNPFIHTHTIVFLHDCGDNARSFARSIGEWVDANNPVEREWQVPGNKSS